MYKILKDKYSFSFEGYEIKKEIQSNCNSKICLIENSKTGEKLVSKAIPKDKPNKIALIISEINILDKLQNPTLFIKLRGYSERDINGEKNESIIMDYMSNGSLSSLSKIIDDDTKFQIILSGIACGMMVLHMHNIIHRDIKPDNILIDKNFHPHIIDFGYSRFINTFGPKENLTVCGTCNYMAKEIFTGRYDTKADVYSFGQILKEFFLTKLPKNESLKKMADKCTLNKPEERPTSREIFKKLILAPSRFTNYINFDDISPIILDEEEKVEINKNSDFSYCLGNVDKQTFFAYVELILKSVKEQFQEEAKIKWSQTVDICQKILSLKTVKIKHSNEFLETISSSLPDISQPESLSSTIQSIFYLDTDSSSFPFNINDKHLSFLSQNIHLFEENEKSFETCSLYIFYTWISTNILILRNSPNSSISTLLTILNNVDQLNHNFANKEQYYEIDTLCFVNLIEMIAENNYGSVNIYLDVFNELRIFLQKDSNLERYAEKIFYVIYCKILNKSECINDQEQIFIDIVKNSMVRNKKILNSDFISTIISIKSQILNKISLSLDDICIIFDLFKFTKYDQYDDFMKKVFTIIFDEVIYKSDSIFSFKLDDNDNNLNLIEIQFPDSFNNKFDIYQMNSNDNDDFIIDLKVKTLPEYITEHFLSQLTQIKDIILSDKDYINFAFRLLMCKCHDLRLNSDIPMCKYSILIIIFFFLPSLKEKFSYNSFPDEIIVFLFDNICQYEILNSLRDIVFVDCFNKIIQIVMKKSNFPMLFHENLSRLVIKMKQQSNDFKDCQILDFLISYLLKYRVMDKNNSYTDTFLKIRRTILYIISFSNQIFGEEEIMRVFSSNTIKDYMELMYEPPIRDKIKGLLIRYLRQIKICDQINRVFNFINDLLHSDRLQGIERMNFSYDILNILYKSMENRNIIQVFEKKYTEIFSVFSDIDISSCTRRSVDSLFALFINLNYKLNSNDFHLFDSIVKKYIQFATQEFVLDQVIKYIKHNKYDVMHTNLLCFLVHNFIKIRNIYTILQYISDCCSKSSEICIKFHELQLDMILISILKEWRDKIIKVIPEDINNLFYVENENGIEINEHVIKLILGIFTKITVVISSASVVQNFFTMLCPIDNAKHLSLIHKYLLETLNAIFVNSRRNPIASLPMLPSNQIDIQKIPPNVFNNRMSFVFWLFYSSDANILTLKVSNKKFKIFLINKKIHIGIENGSKAKSACSFSTDIPIKKWIMITIEFTPNSTNNTTDISMYINESKMHSCILNSVFMPKSDVSCIISGDDPIKNNIQDMKSKDTLIGLFILAKEFDQNDISRLYNECQNITSSYFTEKIIFGYSPQLIGNKLSFKPLHKNKIKETHHDIYYIKKMISFTDFIITYYMIDIIIPIFSMFNLKTREESMIKELPLLAVDVLFNLFVFGKNVQCASNTFEGLNAISHLLQLPEKCPYLTFALYEKFYHLLEVITDEDLKIYLIDVILLNYDLWSKCEQEHKINIFNHWHENLYPQNKYNIDLIRPIEWYLYIIKSNYNENLPLLRLYFENNHSFMNILSIIQYISNKNTCTEEMKGLLSILLIFFEDKEKVDKIKDETIVISFALSRIFNKEKNDDIILNLIKIYSHIIDSLSPDQIIPLIQDIIDLLIIKRKYILSTDTFSSLIDLIKFTNFNIFPIAMATSIYGGSEHMLLLIEEMNIDFDCVINQQSLIYSALALYSFYSVEEVYMPLIVWVINIIKNHISYFINIVEIIGYLCFTKEITEKIISDILINSINKQTGDKKSLIDASTKFILFRFEKIANSKESVNTNENNTNNLFQNLRTKIKICLCKTCVFKYVNGIRLDENDNWLDTDLTNKTLVLIETFSSGSLDTIKKLLQQYIKNTREAIMNRSMPYGFKKTIDNKIISALDSYINSSLKDQNKLTKLFDEMEESNKNFKSSLQRNKDFNHKKWSNLMKSLTAEWAPWAQLVTTKGVKVLKRDKITGFSFCPNRVKFSTIKLAETNSNNKKNIKKGINELSRIKCKIIKSKNVENDAIFQLSNDMIYLFISNGKSKLISISDIYSIVSAYDCHSFSSIQIFTKTGKNFLINSVCIRDIIKKLKKFKEIIPTRIQDSHPKIFINSLKITEKWLKGKISNFEYLMKLNFYSGRSFNDVNQYPIFPWVLAQYDQDEFDLNPSSIYRDLSKPMGALNQIRLDNLKSKGNSFLYKVCYSNQFWVNNCLVRLEPFKKLDSPSDFPEDCNQLLTSINESYKNATTSPNNFYELLPEFYFLPEFLKFSGDKIDDVQLPPWANNSAFDFIYLHRKALESPYVSSHLNEWIDLIWGYKQDGDEAVKADNVFNPQLYEQYKNGKNLEPQLYEQYKYANKTFGQIPRKLFDKEHPKKEYAFKSPIPEFKDEKLIRINMLSGIQEIYVYYKPNKSYLSFLLLSGDKLFSFDLNFNVFQLEEKEYDVNLSKGKKIAKSQASAINESFINNVNILVCNAYDIEETTSLLFPMFINSEDLCYVDNHSQLIQIVSSSNGVINKTIEFNKEIKSIITSQEGWLLVYTNDGSITLYDINKIPKDISHLEDFPKSESFEIHDTHEYDSGPIDSMKYSEKISWFRSSIVCSAISQTYHTFICGTNDNYLLYCRLDLNNMFIDKMIKLKGKPSKIIIMQQFGFVVVYMRAINELTLFSINGEEIKSTKLDEELKIVDMISVSSVPGGFDYLILADNSNSIYVFEAFFLNINQPIYKCNHQSKIVKLTYIKELSLLVAVSDKNTASIFYLPIKG